MADIVVKTEPAKSWKTTVGGILVGAGFVGEHMQTHGMPDDIAGWIGLLFKAFGPVVLGLFARDVNVSSEGKKVVTPEGKTPA